MGEVLAFSARRSADTQRDGVSMIRADQVAMRSIEWLDKPLLQNAAFTLVAGPKGVGKGTWLCKVAAKMTNGLYGPKRNVIFLSSEDLLTIDMRPRLTAVGAKLEHVYFVAEHLTLPRDVERLKAQAITIGDVGMLALDPIGNHLGGVDTDKEGVVRNALTGLNTIADELNCAVLGVRHLTKNRANGALASVLGSTAWRDLPRAVLAFALDDEDEMIFHIEVVAGNRSGRRAGESFRIELADVGLKEPVTKCVELGASTKRVDDLLQIPQPTSKSASARSMILDILQAEGDQDPKALDARIAHETGLTVGSIKNQRTKLANEGLLRMVPLKDEAGKVEGWRVVRRTSPKP